MFAKAICCIGCILGFCAAFGCLAGQTGPTSQTGPTAPASAEAMKDRLANQARAIIELSAENEKLLAKVAELRKEIARLQAQAGGPVTPAPTQAPALKPAPVAVPEGPAVPVAPPSGKKG